jgi:hypothetical protein
MSCLGLWMMLEKNEECKIVLMVPYCATNVPQIIMHCHRFTLNVNFCAVIYAGTYNIFVILTLRPNSGMKKELIAHFSVFLVNY